MYCSSDNVRDFFLAQFHSAMPSCIYTYFWAMYMINLQYKSKPVSAMKPATLLLVLWFPFQSLVPEFVEKDPLQIQSGSCWLCFGLRLWSWKGKVLLSWILASLQVGKKTQGSACWVKRSVQEMCRGGQTGLHFWPRCLGSFHKAVRFLLAVCSKILIWNLSFDSWNLLLNLLWNVKLCE